MSKKIISYIIVFSSLLSSCKKDADLISKHYPLIETLDVSDIGLDGVTFQGEFIDIGTSSITEYGFVFSTHDPRIENSETLIIGSNAKKGDFSESISENLAGNVLYNVKAFAKTNYHVIYGNNIEFLSKGSKYSPWDLVLQSDMSGWGTAHGISSNELGFILFQNRDFCAFDPKTNTVVKKQNIPINGNTGNTASFNLGNYLYILTTGSQQVLRYDIQSDQWTRLGDRPFYPGENCLGFSINNTGYFLERNNFYSYNQSTDTWTKMADIPSNNTHPAGVVNNKAYVLGDYKYIYSYNPEDNTWQIESQYPGTWNGEILSFTQNDKIYWGLSYSGTSRPASDLWEYNPLLDNWKEVENFPIYHSKNYTYTFSTKDYSYLGSLYLYAANRYDIFRFDPKKIK